MKRILLIPPMPWYMEAHAEYLIRYLSDEFFIEVADVPYPPYKDFVDKFPETSPFQRNPDDYDLLVPLLATHWVVTEKEKYKHKTALIWYQGNEGNLFDDLAGIATVTPLAHKSLSGTKHGSLRFGIDTNLFKPLKFARTTDDLVIGMVGNLLNPRRMVKDVIEVVEKIPGVQLKLFMGHKPLTNHDLDFIGGRKALKYIVGGEKTWVGLPNVYNQLDVLVRCDSDPGYSFPVLEAAACAVPVIATDSGIDHEVTKAGGGILIPGDREKYLHDNAYVREKLTEAILFMRDNPTERSYMGLRAEAFIHSNYKWAKHIPAWRKFFREAIK